MKHLDLKLVLVLVLASLSAGAFAQAYLEDPRYGNTPEERKQNVLILNFFNDTYNNKNYDGAAQYLQQLMEKAPKATQNIYIKGADIYRNKILRATSLDQKNIFIDSLMLIYDKRIEHFGDHATRGKGYIMELKAREYITYKPADREGIIKLCQAAIAENGNDSDPDFLNIYFQVLTDDYKNDNIEANFLMNEYEKLAKIFNTNPTPEKNEAKKTFEALFVSSGAASCENLEKLFRPQIAAAPADTALLDKVLGLLMAGNCVSDFQLEVGEKFYALKPSSSTALALAAGFEEKKQFDKALKYLNEAIANETDPATKANLCVRIAGSQLSSNNAQEAAKFAKEAIDIDPENGFAYMLLAQAYTVGSNACSGFDRQSVYWLAYDLLTKACTMLDEEHLKGTDEQLSSYRANFPSKEECFFRGLNNGASYTVRCGWVSGATTVREGR